MPRNTAQQLYDVGYVVYGGEREAGGKEGGEGGRKREEGCQKEKRYREGSGELIEREGQVKVKCKEIVQRMDCG